MSRSSTPPQTVAVLGAGLMGHGLAQVFMLAGSHVRIWDPDPKARATVVPRIAANLDLLGLSRPVNVDIVGSIAEAAADADLVVEAAPEDLAIKRRLIADVERVAPQAVVATNTSVLRISEIARDAARPEQIVGTHWWNPPYLIPVVEVVRGERTSDETLDRVIAWLTAAGKTPVTVQVDAPGFIGNRMQFALWREAAQIVEEGICDAATVDLVARNTFGRRLSAIGPLENADLIGLDLTSAIMDYLLPHLSTADAAPRLFREAVERGDLGAKSGAGVQPWEPGRREQVQERLASHLLTYEGDGPRREPRPAG